MYQRRRRRRRRRQEQGGGVGRLPPHPGQALHRTHAWAGWGGEGRAVTGLLSPPSTLCALHNFNSLFIPGELHPTRCAVSTYVTMRRLPCPSVRSSVRPSVGRIARASAPDSLRKNSFFLFLLQVERQRRRRWLHGQGRAGSLLPPTPPSPSKRARARPAADGRPRRLR